MTRVSVPLLALMLSTAAQAQPVPMSASVPSTGEMPMADYLGLLEQIAPAARDGAQAYVQAFEQRCRRTLTTAALRQAISEGSGDPVLMEMIRASQLRDAKALSLLAQRIDCGGRR
jgi:hypothetical protein